MLPVRSRLSGLTAGLPRAYWLLWIGTVINRLGGFVSPFLSLYLTSERGISISQAGMMVSLLGAGSFASQLVGGELTDRLGRRPVLLMSLLVTPLITIALGLVRDLPFIAAATLLMGFFTDLSRPAVSAAVADLVAPEERVRAFGYIYWAINLGAALAPLIAGFLARAHYLLLFVGDGVTTLIYGFIVLWRFRESQPAAAVHAARVPLSTRFHQIGREPLLLLFTFVTLGFGTIYMQGYVTLPLDMVRHGLGPEAYGIAIAANGILIVLTTIQLSRLVGRWPRFTAVALAAVLLGAGFGMNALAASLPFYVIGVMVWTLGEIIGAAIWPTIIADLAPVELRGLYQGIFGSVWGLSLFVGPILGSWVFERYSPDTLWIGCAALGVVLAIAYLSLAPAAGRRLTRQPGGASSSQ